MALHASARTIWRPYLSSIRRWAWCAPWMSPGTWRSQSQRVPCGGNPAGDGGFLTMDSDYFLHLTDVGREVAEQIYEKHRFFTDRLIEAGVDPETAERDACRIEHVISDESFRRLKAAVESK